MNQDRKQVSKKQRHEIDTIVSHNVPREKVEFVAGFTGSRVVIYEILRAAGYALPEQYKAESYYHKKKVKEVQALIDGAPENPLNNGDIAPVH